MTTSEHDGPVTPAAAPPDALPLQGTAKPHRVPDSIIEQIVENLAAPEPQTGERGGSQEAT